MKKLGLILCVMLTLLNFAVAQNEADALLEEATKMAEEGDFKMANKRLEKAAALYKADNNMSKYYQANAEQGRNILQEGNPEKALAYLENLKEDAQKVFKAEDIALSLIYKYIGYVYYEQNDIVAAYAPFKKALEIRTAVDPNDEDLFRDNYNLGVISRNIGRLKDALAYYKQALALLGPNPDRKYLSKIYLQVATVYDMQGDYGAALDYLDQALSTSVQVYGETSPESANILFEKGNVLVASAVSIQQTEDAIKILNQAVEIFKQEKEAYQDQILRCFQVIGEAYFNIGMYEEERASGKADQFYQKALAYYQDAQAIAEQMDLLSAYTKSLSSILEVYLHQKNAEVAKKYLNELKSLLEEFYPERKGMDWALFYRMQARLAVLEDKGVDDAATIYNNALLSLIRESYQVDIHTVDLSPTLDEDKIISLYYIIDILVKKMYMYSEYYQKTKDIQLLEYAHIHLEQYEKGIDFLRKIQTNGGSKMAWSDFVVEDFGKGIEICLELAKAKKDDSYKAKAYYLSEKSKGLLLLESFQSTKASQFAGLSEPVLAEEERLRLAVSDAKQQLFQLKQARKTETEAYLNKQEEWLKHKKAYEAFVKRLEKEHPEYYKMKYDIKILDVAATQEMLLEDQTLIEYYVTDTKIFTFKIGKNSLEVIQADAPDNLTKDVKAFRESIYGYYLNAGERTEEGYEKYAKQYAEVGYQMYQTLIQPLGDLKKRLIIIPAGALTNMPFEPILMKQPSDPKAYKSHAYLGKSHIIAYNYSATLLSEMRSRDYSKNRKTLLAIAPEFGNDAASFVRGKRFALAPLTFNTVEVENIQKMLGTGTLLMGQDALEPKFKEMGGDYKIMHFATHGMANDRDPDFSLLAFTEIPDSIENEFLYVSDLYNMELKTDLVVLSACETGLGELRKGEGVISLARGFAYAGTKSIFTTLWSVNDQATSSIVEGFYRYLKAGKPKDEALHLAKLDFLEGGNNMTAHPFLWSPYIFIGDSTPIDLARGGNFWLYIGIAGAALILLLGGFMMMKRGGRKAE